MTYCIQLVIAASKSASSLRSVSQSVKFLLQYKLKMTSVIEDRTVEVVDLDIPIGAGDLEFDSRSGQIGRLSVANGFPPLQCFFGAMLSRREAAEMDPATPYTLHSFIL